jgi:predicted ferric reductase
MDKHDKLITFAWTLSAVVSVLAFVAWAQGLAWKLKLVSPYTLFPLLGLLAFSLMWSHYIVAAARLYIGAERSVTKKYFSATSTIVLAAILLHPNLLVWQLWRDGQGLPPNSYFSSYTGPGMKLALALGTLSFWIFLAYELYRWFSKKSWWRFVQYASDLAMLFILYHSFTLGSNLQKGWFRYVWIFYSITFIGSLIYIYSHKIKTAKS